ncbi:MAG: BrnA antitoxin family protein [Alphaproteobacteria bacterium]
MKKPHKPLIDKHGDAREPTTKEWKLFRPMKEVDPALVAAYKRGELKYRGQRGAQKEPTKAQVTLRIDRNTLDFFKSKGEGWQTRINDALAAIVNAAR